MSNFEACLAFLLSPEQDGQPFHITPGDSGGATSYGVTNATWSRWIGRPATLDDMRAVSAADAGQVYRRWYWDTISGDDLPIGVDLMVFDFGVNAGETTAARELQALVHAAPDGIIGPHTITAVRAANPGVLINDLRFVQGTFYRACRDFPRFGNGWMNRLERRAAAAHAMLAASRA